MLRALVADLHVKLAPVSGITEEVPGDGAFRASVAFMAFANEGSGGRGGFDGPARGEEARRPENDGDLDRDETELDLD